MTTPGSARLSASDAFSWSMERDPVLRSSIVIVIWLDRPPDRDAFIDRIDRMSRLMPSLRQRVINSPVPLVAPRWSYDPHFDLNWHVRRIGARKSQIRDVVLDLARQSAMDAFDHARPLWELTLVESGKNGQAALVGKLHHSLSDGVGGMRILKIITDPQREPSDLGELPRAPHGVQLDQFALVTGDAGETTRELTRLAWRGARAAIPALVRSARHPAATARGTVAMARSIYRTAAPSSGTMSPLMRERATTRHLATMEVSLDDLKSAATAIGGTVNDAYLAAVTGGLRRYHRHHGKPVRSLRAVVPISLRAGGDAHWGNKITLQRVTLPTGEPDPAARIRTVHRVTQAARKEPSLPVTGVIAGALNMLPVRYIGGVLKHVDFLASNVAGPPVPHYIAGSKITGLVTFGPTIGASLNTTLVSYARTCTIGVNIDTAAVPDPEVLIACLQESLAEVAALGTAGPGPARPDPPALPQARRRCLGEQRKSTMACRFSQSRNGRPGRHA